MYFAYRIGEPWVLTKVDLVVGCYSKAESEAAGAAGECRGVELSVGDVACESESCEVAQPSEPLPSASVLFCGNSFAQRLGSWWCKGRSISTVVEGSNEQG